MNLNDYSKVAGRMEPREQCRNEVLNMKETKITRKKSRKFIPIMVAAAVAVCGGTTVLAAEYLGAFDRLVNKQERTYTLQNGEEARIDKWDNNNYAAIGENAETIAEPETAAASVLSVKTDSVYCDGRSLIIGFTGALADGNVHDMQLIPLLLSVTMDGATYDINDSRSEDAPFYRFEADMIIDEGTQNSFTGNISLMLKNGIEITKPTTAEVRVYGSSTVPYPEFSEEVVFSVPVSPNSSLRQQNAYSMEEDGFGVKIYEISPAGILAGSTYPEEYKRMGTECSVAELWYDENGNELDGLYWTQDIDFGDGYHAFPLAYTDTSRITVKWVNKQVQDENGNFEVLHEHTFDLT